MRSSAVIPARSKSVLVTGSSSGLGKATVIRLTGLGYRVFAGVRTEASSDALAATPSWPGELIPVLLDVTDSASIANAWSELVPACADTGLWGVVNNAGMSVSAPLECLPLEALRAQLETNVIGTAAVIQRFLSLLRESRGRIVNISSGIANVAGPYLGAYAAASCAKEGLSDALRRELAPLGVRVSLVQPGVVYTPIWRKIRGSADEIIGSAPGDVIEVYRERFVDFVNSNERLARASATLPADVADAVAAALGARHPRPRYRVGRDATGTALARGVVPDRMMDALFGVGFPALAQAAKPRVQILDTAP